MKRNIFKNFQPLFVEDDLEDYDMLQEECEWSSEEDTLYIETKENYANTIENFKEDYNDIK